MRRAGTAVNGLGVTPLVPCPYFQGRPARFEEFWWHDAPNPMPGATYQALMDHRFRRAGQVFYRPVCPTCQACTPIRVEVNGFQPSRSQKRALKRNRDVRVKWGPPEPTAEKLDLYRRYVRHRHLGGADMDSEIVSFLYTESTNTMEACYWADGRLIGVGICDVTPQAISTVYFYFDPDEAARSLGVFSALEEIDFARRNALPFYYLGYWIEGCRKMDYKAAIGSHQLLLNGQWVQRDRTSLSAPAQSEFDQSI